MDDGRDRDEVWLGALLEAAADGYEPDAERLRALVEARIADGADERARTNAAGATRAEPGQGADPHAAPHVGGREWRGRRPTRPVGRLGLLGRLGVAGIPAGVALTAIGAAAAFAVGMTVAVTAHGGRPATIAIVAPSTAADGGAAVSQSPSTPGARPSTGAGATHTASPDGGASSNTAAPPVSASVPANGSATGSDAYDAVASLDAASNPNWAQLDVNLTVREPLTALEITITVAAGPGVSTTGSFDSGASGLFAPPPRPIATARSPTRSGLTGGRRCRPAASSSPPSSTTRRTAGPRPPTATGSRADRRPRRPWWRRALTEGSYSSPIEPCDENRRQPFHAVRRL